MEYFNYNGKLFEESEPVIGPNNRGFRYGDGLFETIKSSKGKLLFAEEHFERLVNGSDVLQFKMPAHLDMARLENEILRLLEKNGHNELARVRLTLFRGNGGLYDEISHYPEYIIQTWALPDNAGQWNSNGLTMGVYTHAKKARDKFCNLKHNNFLPYVMAALYARSEKWNDALILNDAGRVCDSSIANVFLVKDDQISTVSLDEGCVAGVMRKNVLKRLSESDIKVQERAISIEDLLNAEEVFLTNSIFNIRWVQSIGKKKYTNRYIREIYSGILSTILK